MAVHGKVINVTVCVLGFSFNPNARAVQDFLAIHPGGSDALLKRGRAGHDVSTAFERIGHSAKAYAMLEDMCVGDFEREAFR